MKISNRGMILIVTIMLANNLLWLYASKNSEISKDDKQMLIDAKFDNNCSVNPASISKQNNLVQVIPIAEHISAHVHSRKTSKTIVYESDKTETIYDQDSPMTLASIDMDIPIELSQDFQYEQAIAKEDFYYANNEKKMHIIQSLSAQGDDLKLIREVLKTEEDSEIRIEALTRLNQEHSFTATNTLIAALDDPEKEVALTALNTLVANGDRTLLPLLNEKMLSISDNAVRDQYEKSIYRLQYSTTMAMDEIPVQ